MSSNISFFTPVHYSQSFTMRGLVESYFYFSGGTAYVVAGHEQNGREGVVFFHEKESLLATALKIALNFTVFVPILMLIAKVVLRSSHRYHMIDVKQKLEAGMEVAPETIKKIEALLPKILNREKDPDLLWHTEHGLLTFSLTSMPNRVFKVPPPDWSGSLGRIKESFENALKGEKVRLAHNLSQLVIPRQKMFETKIQGQIMPVLMQEKMDIRNAIDRGELYYTSSLTKAIRQLATFITKTGFSNVTYETIPIIDETFPGGDLRVALVNLEEMGSAADGLAKLSQLALVD